MGHHFLRAAGDIRPRKMFPDDVQPGGLCKAIIYLLAQKSIDVFLKKCHIYKRTPTDCNYGGETNFFYCSLYEPHS